MSNEFWINMAIAITLAAIGLAGTWYWGRRSTQRRQPTWASVTLNEVTRHASHVEGLEVLYRYNGEDVPQLSRSNVALWNAGGVAIRSVDAIPRDPLLLTGMHGHRLLDVTVVQNSDETNGFTLRRVNDACWAITFDYLAAKRGVVLRVIHTGLADPDINITGGFIDAGSLRRLYLNERGVYLDREYPLLEGRRSMQAGAVGIGFIGCLGFVWGISLIPRFIRSVEHIHNPSSAANATVDVLPCLLLCGGGIWFLFTAWTLLHKVRRMPPNLDIFQGIITELRTAALLRGHDWVEALSDRAAGLQARETALQARETALQARERNR